MLNNYDFKSVFKDELNYFIKYKRSSGLKHENEIFRLKYIDNIYSAFKDIMLTYYAICKKFH